jgi:hypothetical protein
MESTEDLLIFKLQIATAVFALLIFNFALKEL